MELLFFFALAVAIAGHLREIQKNQENQLDIAQGRPPRHPVKPNPPAQKSNWSRPWQPPISQVAQKYKPGPAKPAHPPKKATRVEPDDFNLSNP